MEMEAMKKLSSPLPGPLAKETFDAFARYEEQGEGDADGARAEPHSGADEKCQSQEVEQSQQELHGQQLFPNGGHHQPGNRQVRQ